MWEAFHKKKKKKKVILSAVFSFIGQDTWLY